MFVYFSIPVTSVKKAVDLIPFLAEVSVCHKIITVDIFW